MKTIITSIVATLLFGFASISAAQTAQTPINITTTTTLGVVPQFTAYTSLNTSANFSMINTYGSQWCSMDNACTDTVGSRWGTLKLNALGTQRITYNSVVYQLLEFHFHAPSEHWVNNSATEMEVHFVFFKVSDFNGGTGTLCNSDSLLVLGQRIVASGSDNAAWNLIFGVGVSLPINSADGYVAVNGFNIQTAIGVDINTAPSYRYTGGLTAPAPLSNLATGGSCTTTTGAYGNAGNQIATGVLPEVVSWVLFKQPIYLSPTQVAKFQALFKDGDARAIQLLNGRPVYSTGN
jgi:carbonic anhydrase